MKKKTAGSKNYMSCRQNWFLNSITSFNIFGANHSLEGKLKGQIQIQNCSKRKFIAGTRHCSYRFFLNFL